MTIIFRFHFLVSILWLIMSTSQAYEPDNNQSVSTGHFIREIRASLNEPSQATPEPATSTTNFPEDITTSKLISFGEAVILAKEEALCIEAFTAQEDKTASSLLFLDLSEKVAKQCANFTDHPIYASEQCQELCNQSDLTHSNICITTCFNLYIALQNQSFLYDEIHERLHEYYGFANISGGGNEINISAEIRTITKLQLDFRSLQLFHGRRGVIFTEANVFCEGVDPEETSDARKHIVVLTWKVKVDGMPLIYVVEQKQVKMLDSEQEHWQTVAKTSSRLYSVDVSYHTSTYRWRITAISTEGIEDVIETEVYTTLDGYQKPGPPNRIYVADMTVSNFSVNVLIGWDPPEENTCYFKIVLDGPNGMKSKAARIYEPLGVHQHWFRNLSLEKTYDVLITSKDRSLNYESSPAIFKFTTPSCLESFDFRFDKCAPPPVNSADITAEIFRIESEIQVELAWKPPINASNTNPIEQYLVVLTSFTMNPNLNAGNEYFGASKYFVPGNVTNLTLKNLTKDTDYNIMITAYSIGGPSPQAQYRLNTKFMFTAHLTKEVSGGNWIYLTILLVAAVAFLLVCSVAGTWNHEKKVNMTRKQYFQSIEEYDASAPNRSVVPPNETSLNIFDENFPRNKWEIPWNDLKMEQVLGQGAFGVVKRAKIHRKKLDEKLRSRGDDEAGFNSAIRSFDQKDPDNETVAVKMVKLSSETNDLHQLIKEVTMMQNIGFHDQIVGLLGACTKANTLCLVLEYCPGGDLLSFIRKVRAKYSTSSALEPLNGRNGVRFSGSGPVGRRKGNLASMVNQRDTSVGGVNHPVNYTDIGGFHRCHSSSEGKNTSWRDYTAAKTTQCVALATDIENGGMKRSFAFAATGSSPKLDYTISPFFPDPNPEQNKDEKEEKDFQSIDEKDILSYARQIAMGMEYLEKNRVVHRDLACRNVLLMGDYKHVKISDFGLSRDIYTGNLYEQKSISKLPIRWMAIESIFEHLYTTKSDVWSYGILLWELISLGATPYPELGNKELFRFLKSGRRMKKPENCSHELYAVMTKCWRTEALSRPSFWELRTHIEAMMQSAEPNLYLSLQVDIPVDFYEPSSRADLDIRRPSDGYEKPITFHGPHFRRTVPVEATLSLHSDDIPKLNIQNFVEEHELLEETDSPYPMRQAPETDDDVMQETELIEERPSQPEESKEFNQSTQHQPRKTSRKYYYWLCRTSHGISSNQSPQHSNGLSTHESIQPSRFRPPNINANHNISITENRTFDLGDQ